MGGEGAGAVRLPDARVAGSYTIALVCLGNICRSPTAHVVLEERLEQAGLGGPGTTPGVVRVTSSGTGGWHVGDTMDRRAAATLTAAGYDASRHRARQFDPDGPGGPADLVLAMDAANLADLAAHVDPDRLALLGAFDPVTPGAEVPDPWAGGPEGFTRVLAMVERSVDVLVAALVDQRPWSGEPSDGRAVAVTR